MTAEELRRLAEIVCPVCGYYCLGNGGIFCIDKKGMYELAIKEAIADSAALAAKEDENG